MLPNQTEFVKYLSTLAPEAETLLLVRQRPYKDRYTWPAFLPTVKIKPEWAIYANTASFHIARLGVPISAAAVNATHCLFLVCDDVGSKSEEPPLTPSWIMETSPDNFQWGYIFSEQPTTGEFSAAIKAIAAAGYTDPGACNPVRNVRVPGSVNLKPERAGFVSRIIEWNPDLEYTLEQICAALGVTPGEADTAQAALTLEDDGNDEVLAWLSDAGHLLARTNSAGWAGVVCPRADRHTDGNPEARYMPATRSFVCLHAHCQDLDTEWFLDWACEHGGPNVNAGLRPDLLASTMTAALAKLAPTPAYPDEVAAIVAEVERKQLGREEKSQLHERWAYLINSDSYFDMVDRQVVSRPAFNAVYRHLGCRRGKARIEAGVWFDEQRDAKGARILSGVTYASGDTALCTLEGDVYGNTWRDARPVAVPGDVTPWLAHCERLIPEREEREHVLDALAYKVQNPRGKVNHAILHASLPGVGKDTLYAPFLWAIGQRNHVAITSDMLHSQFNAWLEHEVYFIQELKQADSGDRRALENRLKNVIAAPPEIIQQNKKHSAPVSVVNRGFVLCTSNERDAIALPSSDRRWFVIWSDCERMSAEAARRLWAWYHAGGLSAVAAWLYARDVSKFNPAATPMWTEAKAVLCEQSLNSAESWLLDAIQHSPEFARGVIGGPFHALLDRLQGQAPSGLKLYQGALLHALGEAGWKDCGRVYSAELQTKKRVFCRAGFENMPKSDLRRMAEPDISPIALVPAPAKEKPAS